MDTKTILATTDPNRLRERLSQIDQQIGALQSERAFVDRRFQILLQQIAKSAPSTDKPTNFVQPLIDESRVRMGFEDACELNNSERTVLNGLSRD